MFGLLFHQELSKIAQSGHTEFAMNVGLWATFQSLWQQFFAQIPHNLMQFL